MSEFYMFNSSKINMVRCARCTFYMSKLRRKCKSKVSCHKPACNLYCWQHARMLLGYDKVLGCVSPFDMDTLMNKRLLNNKYQDSVHDGYDPNETVVTMTTTYEGEGYASMNLDTVRNRFYKGMLSSLKGEGDITIMDIGTGASALLTTFALKILPKAYVVAVEANKPHAKKARAVLKALANAGGRWKVIYNVVGPKTVHLLPETDYAIHELLGFLAGSEGVDNVITPIMKKDIVGYSLPQYAASYCYPVTLNESALKDVIRIKFGTKTMLMSKFPKQRTIMSSNCEPFEFLGLDCTPDQGSVNCMNNSWTDHSFDINKTGVVHGLGTFLWVGTDRPGIPSRLTCRTNYPYNSALSYTTDITSSISSASDDESMASNWQNLVVVFPEPIKVRAGQELIIKTKSKTNTLRPYYQFVVGPQKITLRLDELYPDFENARTVASRH